jgi:membrane-associated phospholipid phosphatase
MISPRRWWWPKRPARVPGARTAGLLAGLGAALSGVSALLLKTGTVSWDESLFRVLNQVPAAAASVLTPLSHLFLPAGIIAVVALAVVYVVARNRSVLPVAAGALAAGTAWLLAHAAKAVAGRPRPYEVMADAVLRQQPAHGTSFPSSHTAVTLAVAITLVPFLARPLAAAGIGYAILVGWSRVYLGVHYPLDILGGAGIGLAAGGVILLAVGTLLRRLGPGQPGAPSASARGPRRSARRPRRPEGLPPESTCAHSPWTSKDSASRRQLRTAGHWAARLACTGSSPYPVGLPVPG